MISLADIEKGQTLVNSEDLLDILNEALLLGYKAEYLEIENEGESFRIFWIKN